MNFSLDDYIDEVFVMYTKEKIVVNEIICNTGFEPIIVYESVLYDHENLLRKSVFDSIYKRLKTTNKLQ